MSPTWLSVVSDLFALIAAVSKSPEWQQIIQDVSTLLAGTTAAPPTAPAPTIK
jgi:hypothetical protein